MSMFDREEAFVLAVQAVYLQSTALGKGLLLVEAVVRAAEVAATRVLPHVLEKAVIDYVSTHTAVAETWPLRVVSEPSPDKPQLPKGARGYNGPFSPLKATPERPLLASGLGQIDDTLAAWFVYETPSGYEVYGGLVSIMFPIRSVDVLGDGTKAVDAALQDMRQAMQLLVRLGLAEKSVSGESPSKKPDAVFTAEQARQYVRSYYDRDEANVPADPTFEELTSCLDDSIRIRARRGKSELNVFKVLFKDHYIVQGEINAEMAGQLELHYEDAGYNWWSCEKDIVLSWAD